jgi:hypothetical protein
MQAILKRGNVYRWISDVFGAAREALDLGRRRAQPRSRPGGSGLPAPLSTEPPRAAPEPGTAAASA